MSASPADVWSPGQRALPLRKTCQYCNIAKLKCDGHRPQCARCSRRGTACLYAPSKPVGRPPRRPTQQLSAPALRGLRPTDHSNFSTPPTDNSEPTQSTESHELYIANQCGPPTSPTRLSPHPRADCSVYDQAPESYITDALCVVDDGVKPDFKLDPMALASYPSSDAANEFVQGDSGLSFLAPLASDGLESRPATNPPSLDDSYSPFTPLPWSFDDHLPGMDWSPSLAQILAPRSIATPTTTTEPTWISSLYGSSSTAPACTCLTTIINVLVHRSKMRKEILSSSENGSATTPWYEELEGLMQQGLSTQQRCRFCLEDPLVSMIWARVTDEYLTTVIASRQKR
ncbi:hypothetical protein QBC37DRAFT_375246 [Rhypophila decipiens]|uniref:Zn(2)-C6 fungal-type domain-containing protein n=1 Tax=Rhypophila decipiens TaxID=261697 RepID=A0AAN6Y6M9_9PEZI|nr:hypothetical protein QBC37DRAFT_375246 [Rhypophila decipiens]